MTEKLLALAHRIALLIILAALLLLLAACVMTIGELISLFVR